MELQQINPYIRFCRIWPQVTQHSTHVKAYDCRIFYVLSGNGYFYIEDKRCPFSPDTFVFIPSGIAYRFSYNASEAVQFLILNFDLISDHTYITDAIPPDADPNFDSGKLLPTPEFSAYMAPYLIADFQEARQDLLSIHRLFVNQAPFYGETASGILKKVLIQVIAHQHNKSVSVPQHTVDTILAYVRRHYSEPITNQAIAAHFGFHPYYLNRIIKASVGQSLHQYLLCYRIQEAQRLLATSSAPAYTVAALTGFGTASQFSSTFKRITGYSPAEYRKQHNQYV